MSARLSRIAVRGSTSRLGELIEVGSAGRPHVRTVPPAPAGAGASRSRGTPARRREGGLDLLVGRDVDPATTLRRWVMTGLQVP